MHHDSVASCDVFVNSFQSQLGVEKKKLLSPFFALLLITERSSNSDKTATIAASALRPPILKTCRLADLKSQQSSFLGLLMRLMHFSDLLKLVFRQVYDQFLSISTS